MRFLYRNIWLMILWIDSGKKNVNSLNDGVWLENRLWVYFRMTFINCGNYCHRALWHLNKILTIFIRLQHLICFVFCYRKYYFGLVKHLIQWKSSSKNIMCTMILKWMSQTCFSSWNPVFAIHFLLSWHCAK